MQKSLFWKVKEPLSQRESGTFVFSLCGDYFPFTFVNCFTDLKIHAKRVFFMSRKRAEIAEIFAVVALGGFAVVSDLQSDTIEY